MRSVTWANMYNIKYEIFVLICHDYLFYVFVIRVSFYFYNHNILFYPYLWQSINFIFCHHNFRRYQICYFVLSGNVAFCNWFPMGYLFYFFFWVFNAFISYFSKAKRSAFCAPPILTLHSLFINFSCVKKNSIKKYTNKKTLHFCWQHPPLPQIR